MNFIKQTKTWTTSEPNPFWIKNLNDYDIIGAIVGDNVQFKYSYDLNTWLTLQSEMGKTEASESIWTRFTIPANSKIYISGNYTYFNEFTDSNNKFRFEDSIEIGGILSTLVSPDYDNIEIDIDYCNSIFRRLFNNCLHLKYAHLLILPKLLNTAGLNYNNLFMNCVNLETVPLIFHSYKYDFRDTFSGCTSIEIPKVNTSTIYGCWFTSLVAGSNAMPVLTEKNTSTLINYGDGWEEVWSEWISEINAYGIYLDTSRVNQRVEIRFDANTNLSRFLTSTTEGIGELCDFVDGGLLGQDYDFCTISKNNNCYNISITSSGTIQYKYIDTPKWFTTNSEHYLDFCAEIMLWKVSAGVENTTVTCTYNCWVNKRGLNIIESTPEQ